MIILTVVKIGLSKSYHNLQHVLPSDLIWFRKYRAFFIKLNLMDVLAICFEPFQVLIWYAKINTLFSIGKTNILEGISSADAMAMMIWRYIIPETGAYNTGKSTPSSTVNPYVQVLEYN